MKLKSAVRVTSNTNEITAFNEYDVDDEEDFIKVYFASGTVLKPSDKPYDLRSKIHEANRELANASAESKLVNAPGKVKFDNTVVILDSFEDIGTVSIGTETLQGTEVIISDCPIDDLKDKDILAKIDLLRDDDADDQNDVVCSSTTDRTQDTDTDDKAYSSTSFSRSFSSESDDPLFINIIESGDEFKTIMDRNNKTRQGSAIDEHVTYFPELFTHTQYKMYENCAEKTLEDGDVNIYVPKKLDAEELRNKLKEITGERKRAMQVVGAMNEKKVDFKSTKKVGCFASLRNAQKKIKQTKISDKKMQSSSAQICVQQQMNHCGNGNNINKNNINNNNNNKARMTYYFEMDPKGKLKPLNNRNSRHTVDETSSSNNCNNKSTNKFFHINLRAAKNGENAKPRITKTPNADLFLEFQTDKSGNSKGAKLVIKKKPTAEVELHHSPTNYSGGGTVKKSSVAGCGERPRLPGYNGLRSEYGLSAEQLLERRNMRMERERRRKELKQKKHEEEQKKRAENEKNFYKWLQQKKQLKKHAKTIRRSYPMNKLTVSSARVSINSTHDSDRRKGSFALEELLKIKDENSGWFKF
ncbi:transcription initiation factor TFIID subunit 1 [Melanaphis sacchari]|uniref:transcription initiation factor TFIID subunit 1 n=1 Tax=Melanaphis sacchari TaxID=742174 RepID=UPI000DC13699|nr:transcription initiation factor TFIID subunit 1 [Melanaphis sacchari]